MDGVLVGIETSGFSVWMREDLYAYFIALIFHSLGMALLVGGGVVVCLRVLGLAGGAELKRFRGFFPVMWVGAGLAIVSGVALLIGYPAKALTNPLFLLKLIFLAAGGVAVGELGRMFPDSGTEMPNGARGLAALVLVLWAIAVAAGKLLLHTFTVLTVAPIPEVL